LIGDGKKNMRKGNKLSGREGKNVENEKNGIPEKLFLKGNKVPCPRKASAKFGGVKLIQLHPDVGKSPGGDTDREEREKNCPFPQEPEYP
jgi:hypothetical protein